MRETMRETMRKTMRQTMRKSRFATSLFALPILVAAAGTAQATTPTIQLFPTTVVEDLKQTSAVAQEMETGLQEVIGRLDQQRELYLVSKCEGADSDPGCERLARQIGATYLEMLTIMDERLPDMEHTVNNTRLSLEKRLKSEIGNKMTPSMMQEMLLGGAKAEDPSAPAPSLRGRSGMRLSERFRQYYQLVASSGGSSDESLAVLASDIYLDMDETAVLIARTREEIARASLVEQLNQSFGTITPEMMEVVGGVKSILFGDQAMDYAVSAPPPGQAEGAYVSPLED